MKLLTNFLLINLSNSTSESTTSIYMKFSLNNDATILISPLFVYCVAIERKFMITYYIRYVSFLHLLGKFSFISNLKLIFFDYIF